tara:strand:- start:593 stop:847 length:255 start_codon:yes stop_codon:yes gene_type:complete
MSEVSWDPNARKFMRKLSKKDSFRIFDKVDNEITHDVVRYLENLQDRDEKKIRIGDYRLFVSFDKEKDLLGIHSIRHRKNAYKR